MIGLPALKLCSCSLSMGPYTSPPPPPPFLLFHSIARSHRLDMCDLTPPSWHFHGQPNPKRSAWAVRCRIAPLIRGYFWRRHGFFLDFGTYLKSQKEFGKGACACAYLRLPRRWNTQLFQTLSETYKVHSVVLMQHSGYPRRITPKLAALGGSAKKLSGPQTPAWISK